MGLAGEIEPPAVGRRPVANVPRFSYLYPFTFRSLWVFQKPLALFYVS
jgi:hypothetical protein